MQNMSHLKCLPITGYLNNISGRPGEKFEAKVSTQKKGEYTAEVVRIICADPNPDGPGLRYECQNFNLLKSYQGRSQKIDLGSYAEIPAHPCFVSEQLLIRTLIQPGFLRKSFSIIASSRNKSDEGWVLEVNSNMIKLLKNKI